MGFYNYNKLPNPTEDLAKRALVENWNNGYWYYGVRGLGIIFANYVGISTFSKTFNNAIANFVYNITDFYADLYKDSSRSGSGLVSSTGLFVNAISIAVGTAFNFWYKRSYNKWFKREQAIDK